jgi:RNA polymerase sigma-70 factor (ECF subfamily)
MLLTDARRPARVDPDGQLVLLAAQDRTLWDRAKISEGRALVARARRSGRPGPHQLQAAIAAVHDEAARPEDTDWRGIVDLYDELMAVTPSPVVALNRAVAVSMVYGPAAGLALVDRLTDAGSLDGYAYLHSSRADLLRQLDRRSEAVEAYRRAATLTTNDAERAFLERRVAEVSSTI